MGIIISGGSGISENTYPLPVTITLECDATTEFFCRGVEKFEHPDGYIAAHSAAMKAGWLERQSPQGRLWLCPACSGK